MIWKLTDLSFLSLMLSDFVVSFSFESRNCAAIYSVTNCSAALISLLIVLFFSLV